MHYYHDLHDYYVRDRVLPTHSVSGCTACTNQFNVVSDSCFFSLRILFSFFLLLFVPPFFLSSQDFPVHPFLYYVSKKFDLLPSYHFSFCTYSLAEFNLTAVFDGLVGYGLCTVKSSHDSELFWYLTSIFSVTLDSLRSTYSGLRIWR